jgi:GT2 family glycosyltransferase/glycosyltransferase involved in cell wall biosynthesis
MALSDLRVLYITNRGDAPYRYRCLNACSQLRADSVQCDVLHIRDPRLAELLPQYSVVVLFRLPWSSRIETLVKAMRTSGASLVFDIDDLTFDPDRLEAMPFLRNAAPLARQQYEDAAARLKRTLDACDAFIGATPALARAAQAMGKRAFVHPNLLHPKLLRSARLLYALRGLMQREPLIAYMSGSATHNEDFGLAAPVLARIMAERHDVRLMIGGFLELPGGLAAYSDRIIRLPFQDWRVQLWPMNLARVNLAPLAEINEFTNGKSALKFFEAGAIGLPTVATPTEPFEAAIRSGTNGFLANTAEAWYEAVVTCLDLQTARCIGDRARVSALAEHSHAGHRNKLRDILLSVNGRAARPYQSPRPALLLAEYAASEHIPSVPMRLLRKMARARARIGVLRSVPDPRRLSRPDRAQPHHIRVDHVAIDSAATGLQAHMGSPPPPGGRVRRDGALAAQWVCGRPQPLGPWCVLDSIRDAAGDKHDWLTCGHNDPAILSPQLYVQPARFAALVVSMAAEGDCDGLCAQLFWATTASARFTEAASLTFPLVCDGRLHNYVVRLAETAWPKTGPAIRTMRLDPTNSPGRFRVEAIVLLAEEPLCVKGAPRDPSAGDLHPQPRSPGRHGPAAPDGPAVGVDVVVPIYNARRDVERCVESVLRHATGDWRLVLVDDASTDEGLAEYLRRTAASHPRVELLRNERNGGFVVTANRGMRHAAGRDVALLNSDTIATEGFLDRLKICAYADERTGIVTPFTNNGTICSIPEWLRDNDLPTDMSVDEYARLVSSVGFRRYPELVTAVGFCMYVRAGVLEKVGYFDEEHFGRGFGEENDFCERAKAAGYRIRLCDDLFIAHTGKASFGDEGRRLEHVNSKTMDRLHPRYFADVAEFCHRNPLRDSQANVRFHLRRRRGHRYPAMMFVVHASTFTQPMGGTEHVVRDLIRHLALPRALIVFPEDEAIVAAEVFDGSMEDPLFYRFKLSRQPAFFQRRDAETEDLFGQIVDAFGVGAAHIHHCLRWPVGIWRELRARRIPYAFTMHDYYSVCPSWNLLNQKTGEPCACGTALPGGGAGAASAVQSCIAAQHDALNMDAPRDAGALLREHRAEFGPLLANAEMLLAPSRGAYEVVHRCYPAISRPIHVIGHGYDRPGRSGSSAAPGRLAAAGEDQRTSNEETAPALTARKGVPLRVALLGAVAYPAKGADDYVELMDAARSLPIEWHVFGDADVYDYHRRLEKLRLRDRLHLHGLYQREDVFDLLAANAIDVTLLLPACDETFCFTLSESLLAGVPAIVSNAGALPERVRESGAGIIVENTPQALETLRRLATDRVEMARLTANARAFHHPTLQENADRHKQAYGRLLDLVTAPSGPEDITDVEREIFWAHHDYLQEAAIREGLAGSAGRPSYHASWWYPWYLRVKPLVPPAWRGATKRAYLRASRSIVGLRTKD